jgi:hypothetical protein
MGEEGCGKDADGTVHVLEFSDRELEVDSVVLEIVVVFLPFDQGISIVEFATEPVAVVRGDAATDC